MEKMSRIKKYEELRKSIDTDNNINTPLHEENSEEQVKTLQSFNSSVFKKVAINEENETTPKREKTLEEEIPQKRVVDDTFTNEYLDDFIKEVREYNIKNGNRESENTQVDILSQLNATNRAKRAHYLEDIKEENEKQEEANQAVLSKEEISNEVENLIREENEIVNEPIPTNEDIYATRELILDSNPILATKKEDKKAIQKKVIQPDFEDENMLFTENSRAAILKDDKIHKKLIEETQQLKTQLNEYEDELTDLSDGVEKNNKVLNIILYFLILVLTAIIGFIGYTIWKAGGF
ncbi:MAG: hypothetical protein RR537_06940 [Longicatena sp.]